MKKIVTLFLFLPLFLFQACNASEHTETSEDVTQDNTCVINAIPLPNKLNRAHSVIMCVDGYEFHYIRGDMPVWYPVPNLFEPVRKQQTCVCKKR